MSIAEKAKVLREQGKTFPEIAEELGCSKSTVSYHLSDGQKTKAKDRVAEYRKSNSHRRKVENFQNYRVRSKKVARPESKSTDSLKSDKIKDFVRNGDTDTPRFTYAEVEAKFGQETNCYLTGEKISLDEPRTYEFDHMDPKSRGGSNSIDNLGIATKEVNRAKGALTVDEFLNLCEKVLKHHGRL